MFCRQSPPVPLSKKIPSACSSAFGRAGPRLSQTIFKKQSNTIMKTRLQLVASLFLMAMASFALATPRSAHSSGPYRGPYQRMATGCNSQSGYEIRGGTLWAWGNNKYGQLGDGTAIDRRLPVQIGTAANWQRIACGELHTLALRSDGTLWAWGLNARGQLGDGSVINKSAPTQIGSDTDWVSIACGAQHSLALKSDGTLWAWGYNNTGQLGLGNNTGKSTPAQVGTDNKWVAVAGGYYHTLALKSDGSLWAWGWSAYGQVGDGSNNSRNAPVRIGADTSWTSIACGVYHSLALKSDGSLWAWGNNFNGQVGDSSSTNRNAPVRIGRNRNWIHITAGQSHSLALRGDGTLWAWGNNASAQLGDSLSNNVRVPARIGQAADWVDIAAGLLHNYGVRADGTLYAWGINTDGQLGDSSRPLAVRPFALQRSTREWLRVATGSSHSIALKSDGTLWAWGGNNTGELGDGSTLSKASPVQIGSSNQWANIACGSTHNLALRADGSLWSWGSNANGQLGIGTSSNQSAPQQIGAANDWIGISCGAYHSLALKSDGTLWAWGGNAHGQLGDGTTADQSSPLRIGSDSNWVAVAGGGDHSLALKSDGTLWAWGLNSSGQLGDGSTSDRATPVQVGVGAGWLSIAAGGNHSIALRSDGTLWAWGENASGQLGNGSQTSRNAPVQIGTGMKWTAIAAGENHTSALSSGGSLWTWGSGAQGQLGTGSSSDVSTPVCLSSQSNVVALSGGSSACHNALITAGRAGICMTGKNADGQLGNGSTTGSTMYQCSNDICSKFSLVAAAGTTLTRALGGPGNRSDFETSCSLLASITPTGGNPAAGTATLQVLVDGSVQSFNGHAYAQRHYDIQPSGNASTATASLTLYFTQAEFDAYNAANGADADLPSGPTDTLGMSNLRVSQFHSTPNGGFAPADYPKTWSGSGPATVLLIPDSVHWNGDDSRWEVTISVTGFSGFFVHGDKGGTPLPLGLESFSARVVDGYHVMLEWEVAHPQHDARYEVERSRDGSSFSTIGTVMPGCSSTYDLRDLAPLKGRSFYRLKVTHRSSSVSYSPVRSIYVGSGSHTAVYPVPAGDHIVIQTDEPDALSAAIYDMQGRALRQIPTVNSGAPISVAGLPAGMYLLRLSNGECLRLEKQ
jgi:alpha-tubulin suppressor-like RCC1 family protein